MEPLRHVVRKTANSESTERHTSGVDHVVNHVFKTANSS